MTISSCDLIRYRTTRLVLQSIPEPSTNRVKAALDSLTPNIYLPAFSSDKHSLDNVSFDVPNGPKLECKRLVLMLISALALYLRFVHLMTNYPVL